MTQLPPDDKQLQETKHWSLESLPIKISLYEGFCLTTLNYH